MTAGPIYGIIDQPYIGERFEGGLGRARVVGPMGEAALATRAPAPLGRGDPVFSTFPEVGTPEEGAAFRRVAAKARLVRYGTDCYAYALIAAGQIDLVIEAGLQAYDVQAPIAVIEAAGGIVTDWQGRPAHDGGPHPCRRQPRRSMPRRWRFSTAEACAIRRAECEERPMSGHGDAQPMKSRKSGALKGVAEVPGDKSISHR